MKILQIHNTYQHKGGEDSVVQAERDLLTSENNEVLAYFVTNDTIQGLKAKIATGLNSHYSKSQKSNLYSYLVTNRPDIVHCHNFFPLLTPSIYDACIEAGIPIVQTLHNYRAICAGALLMRHGKICEQCINGTPYQSVIYQCYRQSVIGSLVVAKMVDYHRRNNTWQTKVNRFITLTEFSKNKFVQAGFPEQNITVKPNFVADSILNPLKLSKRESYALFVGRFSQEKGISTLLQAWQNIDFPLKLAGDGALLNPCKRENQNSVVSFLGNQSKSEVRKLMGHARFLVMPSIWYETFGMVIIEAFAQGLPVICSRLGGMTEIVEDGITGLHFEAGNAEDLANKVNWLIQYPEICEKMGQNARAVYLEKYTPEKNYQQLMAIYQDVIEEAANTKN